MRRDQVKTGVLLLVACIVGYLCYLMVQPFLLAIIWASILAIITTPMHKRLQARVASPSLAALLACLVALFVVVIPIGVVLTIVGQTIVGLLNDSVLGDNADPEAISRWITNEAQVITNWLDANIGIHDVNVSMTDVKAVVSNVVAFLASQSKGFLGGVAGFVFNLILVLLTLFFFLRDRDAILGAIRAFLPLTEKNATTVFNKVEEVIRACVIGGGAVALAQGMLALIGFWILGVPSAILWGSVTAFASFIPFVGAAAVWVPAVIYLFIKGSTVKAIILLLYGMFVISMVDNIIRPILVGDRTSLPTVLLLFSILGGLNVFGFLGIIMGPVVLVVAMALIEVFRFEMSENDEAQRLAAAAGSGALSAEADGVPSG